MNIFHYLNQGKTLNIYNHEQESILIIFVMKQFVFQEKFSRNHFKIKTKKQKTKLR